MLPHSLCCLFCHVFSFIYVMLVLMQLERRVVNQLATAYEQQIIIKGDSVHLKVQNGDEGSQVQLQVTKGPHSKGLHRVHDIQIF